MMRLIALLLAAALLSGTAIADRSPLDAAEQAWVSGDTEAAIERLRAQLRSNPNDADARLLLARILLDAGRYAAAAALLRERGDAAARAVRVAALLQQGDTSAVLALTEPLPDTAEDRDRAWLLVSRGQALMALGTVDAAERALRDASIADPNSARPLVGLAELAERRGDADAASALLERATEARSDISYAWSALGDNAWRKGDFKAAKHAYSTALTGARSTWSLRYRRALAAIELGELEAAQRDVDAVQREVPGFAGSDYVLGRVRLAEGDATAALEHLDAFLKQQPAEPSALYYAAAAHLQLGQQDAAEPMLAALRKSRPQDLQVVMLLAQLWLDRGDAAEAERLLQPFLAMGSPPSGLITLYTESRHAQGKEVEDHLLVDDGGDTDAAAGSQNAMITEALVAARRLEAEGRLADAITAVRDLVGQQPQDARARARLVELLLKAGDLTAAEAAAQAFVTALPDTPLALAARAVVQSALGNSEAARLDLLGALRLDADYADAALGLALVQAETDRPAAARKTLEDTLERDPANAAALLLLAQLDALEGGADAFQERLRAGVAANPQSLAMRALLVRSLLAHGRPNDALMLVQDAPSQTPEPGRLLLEAEALLALERPLPAVANLRKVAELVPDSAAVRYALANARLRAGQKDDALGALLTGFGLAGAELLSAQQLQAMLALLDSEAERGRWLAEAAQAAPDHPAVLEVQADFALADGRPEAAAKAYQRLLEAAPHQGRFRVGLARALHAAGKPEDALALLASMAGSGTADTEVFRLLGTLSLIRGDKARAEAAYREVLAREPGDPLAANNLANLLLAEQPREALRLAKLAETMQPDDPDVQDTLGVALLANGHADAARQMLERAAVASGNPTIRFHYAQSLVAVGEPAEARLRLLPLLGQEFPEAGAARELHAELTGGP